MSIDCDSVLGIGYLINPDTLPDQLARRLPEIWHWENRYDPRTGRKLDKQEKVVTEEASVTFVLGGEEYDDFDEFLEAVAEKVGGCAGVYWSGSDRAYLIQPTISEDDDGQAGIELELLLLYLPKIRKIGERLRDLGFKVSKPRVYPLINLR